MRELRNAARIVHEKNRRLGNCASTHSAASLTSVETQAFSSCPWNTWATITAIATPAVTVAETRERLRKSQGTARDQDRGEVAKIRLLDRRET